MASKSARMGSLAALAAAALASPVALASANSATNVTAVPSEAASVSNDALIRVAQYDAVRKKYILRPTKKPRFLPPNPCRIKSPAKRCSERRSE